MPNNYVNPNKVDPVTGGWKPPVVTPPANPTNMQGTMTTPTPPATPPLPAANGTQTAQPSQGLDPASFSALLARLNGGLQQNNQLVDQKDAVVQAMLGNHVDPQKLSTLPPDIQSIIQKGDRNALMLQAQILNNSIQGRNDQVASSLGFLVNGYKTDLAQAEKMREAADKKRQDAIENVLKFAGIYGSNTGSVLKSLYGQDYLNELKKEGIDVNSFTSTQTLAEKKGSGTGGSPPTGGTTPTGNGTGFVDVSGKPIKLTATQADTITGFENTKGAAQMALNLLAQGAQSGPITGRILQGAKLFGVQDDKQLQLEQTLAKLKADFMKAISGAAVSESEAARLAKFLPEITDQESVIKSKLNTLLTESDRTKANLLKTLGAVSGTTASGQTRVRILVSPSGQSFDSSELSDPEYQEALDDGFKPQNL